MWKKLYIVIQPVCLWVSCSSILSRGWLFPSPQCPDRLQVPHEWSVIQWVPRVPLSGIKLP